MRKVMITQGGVCQPAGMAIAAAINARAVPQQPCHQLPALCHHKVMLKHTSAAAHNSRACGAQAWQHLAGQLPSTAAIAWQAPVSASRQMSTAIMCHSTQQPGSPQQISWLSQAHQWPSQMQTSMDHGTPLGENGNGSSRSAFGSGNYNSNSGSSSSSSNGYNRHSSETQPGFAALDATDLHEQHIDAIMVLAGGLTPHGGLPDWVHRRLDVARDLHLLKDRKPPIICLGGGTPHKPVVVGHNGHVIHESTSCAKYLMEAGVQAADILKEVSSYDTVGNAYFSLTIHALPAGWRRIAVVTSHFHMPRSMSLFADLYRMAGSYYFGDPHWYSLTFLSASDDGVFDDYVYQARINKEAGSLAHWQRVVATLPEFSAFHAWLHADHLCYAVSRQHEFGKQTIKDLKLLESY